MRAGGRTHTLYLNGLYWGVYNVHERPDAAHYAEYHGGSADDYDARNGTTVTDGTATSYNRMRSTVSNGDWQAVQAVLDIDNFIDWTIVQAYGGNEDIKLNGNWACGWRRQRGREMANLRLGQRARLRRCDGASSHPAGRSHADSR